MPKTFNFLFFSSLASLAIYFKPNFNKNTAKTYWNMILNSTVNIFNDFLLPPLTKSTPPKVKSWIRHWDNIDKVGRMWSFAQIDLEKW